MTESGFFGETFALKIGKMGQHLAKKRFLEFIKNISY